MSEYVFQTFTVELDEQGDHMFGVEKASRDTVSLKDSVRSIRRAVSEGESGL